MDFIRGFASGALLGTLAGMCGGTPFCGFAFPPVPWGMPFGGFAPPPSIFGFPMGGGCGCCHHTSFWVLG